MTREMRTTGNAVARAKTAGTKIASPVFNAIGMSIPKNRTAKKGQSARAKMGPSRNPPNILIWTASCYRKYSNLRMHKFLLETVCRRFSV
jgi:hypothetical protein